jgi:hypothetical protein
MAGGGIALLDCDNDGRLDIAVVNDSTIEQYLKGGDLMVTLYHQDITPGGLHFTDVTRSAGLTTTGWGMGIAVGDFDNDGLPISSFIPVRNTTQNTALPPTLEQEGRLM